MAPSKAKADLQLAYTATCYRVYLENFAGAAHLDLKAGEWRVETEQLLMQYNCEQACFITAWNPLSRICSEADNQQRQLNLLQDVRAAGLATLPACGLPNDQSWPAEESILILGLNTDAALALAEKYQQYALLQLKRGLAAQLHYTALFTSCSSSIATSASRSTK